MDGKKGFIGRLGSMQPFSVLTRSIRNKLMASFVGIIFMTLIVSAIAPFVVA